MLDAKIVEADCFVFGEGGDVVGFDVGPGASVLRQDFECAARRFEGMYGAGGAYEVGSEAGEVAEVGAHVEEGHSGFDVIDEGARQVELKEAVGVDRVGYRFGEDNGHRLAPEGVHGFSDGAIAEVFDPARVCELAGKGEELSERAGAVKGGSFFELQDQIIKHTRILDSSSCAHRGRD